MSFYFCLFSIYFSFVVSKLARIVFKKQKLDSSNIEEFKVESKPLDVEPSLLVLEESKQVEVEPSLLMLEESTPVVVEESTTSVVVEPSLLVVQLTETPKAVVSSVEKLKDSESIEDALNAANMNDSLFDDVEIKNDVEQNKLFVDDQRVIKLKNKFLRVKYCDPETKEFSRFRLSVPYTMKRFKDEVSGQLTIVPHNIRFFLFLLFCFFISYF